MSLNKLVIDTLSVIGVPVAFQEYEDKDKVDTYITFFEYDQRGARFSDDVEQNTRHFIQVDVWSKGNYETIVDEVKTNLKEVGFTRTSEIDLFERDTKIYHKGMRFNITI